MSKKAHDPIHPGEILLLDFLEPMGISQYKLAMAINVPPRRINEIIQGKRRITADTGLRLSKALGLTDSFWTGLQLDYDNAVTKDAIEDQLEAITPLAS